MLSIHLWPSAFIAGVEVSYFCSFIVELNMHVTLNKSGTVKRVMILIVAEDFVDLCARASDLARESSGAPMFTVVENNNARSDSLPAEISTPSEQGPSEEDWQIL
jgi:hypothetical protein